ncbi:hypothetical protein [Streptomyces cyaneofuscatus]|uniref:hypothetical protein n=1 Tax=Streptomyces cyaneofuscatus TaxID=66883 RepID=UPI0036674D7A
MGDQHANRYGHYQGQGQQEKPENLIYFCILVRHTLPFRVCQMGTFGEYTQDCRPRPNMRLKIIFSSWAPQRRSTSFFGGE